MITISKTSSKFNLLSKVMNDVKRIGINCGALALHTDLACIEVAIDGLTGSYSISNNFLFASYIRTCIREEKDITFNLDTTSYKISFGGVEANIGAIDAANRKNNETVITMTKEELIHNFRDNVKKFTSNNFWKSPKLTNVSVIFAMEGKLYNAAPGSLSTSAYKIGKLFGTIDNALVDHLFGHSKFGIVIPEVVYDACECSDSNSFKFGFNSDAGTFTGDGLIVSFTNQGIKTKLFESKLALINSQSSYKKLNLDPNYLNVAKIASSASATEEDYAITVRDGDIIINDCVVARLEKSSNNYFNNITAPVINEIANIKNPLKFASFEEDSYYSIFDETDETYYIIYKD